MRFVILSFLFLFWAFYELSGGADFEPRGRRDAPTPRAAAETGHGTDRRPDAAPAAVPIPEGPGSAPAAARAADAAPTTRTAPRGRRMRPPSPAAADLVARPAIAGRTGRSAEDAPPGTAGAAAPSASPSAPPSRPPRIATSVSAGIALFPPARTGQGARDAPPTAPAPAPTGIAPGPVASPSPARVTASSGALAAARAPDIREIAGTRVNMRAGPGTIYPAIARLTLGQKVEVLEDSGTGWLRLKTLRSGLRGWVAASLVRRPAR